MADLYDGFDHEGELEENDEDIGALGSILSWDDEDEDAVTDSANGNHTPRPVATGKAALSSLPPPTNVQFANFQTQQQQLSVQQPGAAGAGANNPNILSAALNMFGQQQQQPQQQQQNGAPTTNVQQQQQQPQQSFAGNNSNMLNSDQQQQQQQGMAAANFAQLLAQQVQAGNLLQQQQQQQQVNSQQPPQQQQNGQQQQQVNMRNLQQAFMLQQQQLQQQDQQAAAATNQAQQQQQAQQQAAAATSQAQQQQPQQQQVAQQQGMQLPYTSDPNAFLQQLQFAQLQQQLQAQQANMQQTNLQQPAAAAAASKPAALQASLQQQLNAQLSAGGGQQQQQAALQHPRPLPVPSSNNAAAGVPPRKRAKTAPSGAARGSSAAAPKTTAKHTTKMSSARAAAAASTTAAGIVSASDTDGEASRRDAKKSSSAATAVVGMQPEPVDTSNMNAAEKTKVNRDRNREHARNTRLRKKQYLEKLKITVDELCRERDTLVSERAGAANLLVDMHSTRTEVLMSFFALRSANDRRRQLWSSILDESCFACVMPVTPYRSFPASEVQISKCQRTILGIDGMMSDTASLHLLFQSLVDRAKYPTGKIEFRYTLVTEEAVVAGNQMMARWVMSTINATQFGSRNEVAKQGMLCCKFNSSHKIIGLELMFDVMAFMLQLKQASASDGFAVIPNTVQTCQRTFDKPMVMTLAEPPYTILQVNKLWEDMTGYAAEEVVGKTSCAVLRGEKTDPNASKELMQDVRYKSPSSAVFVNYKKTGEVFRHWLQVYPLSTDSKITHYLGLSTHYDDSPAAAEPLAAPAPVPVAAKQQQPAVCMHPVAAAAAPMMVLQGAGGVTANVTGAQMLLNGQMPPPSKPMTAAELALKRKAAAAAKKDT